MLPIVAPGRFGAVSSSSDSSSDEEPPRKQRKKTPLPERNLDDSVMDKRPEEFKKYFRMSKETFKKLVVLMGNFTSK